MPGTDVVIRTTAEKWEERRERLEAIPEELCFPVCGSYFRVLVALLVFAAMASIGGVWFYGSALSPAIIGTRLDYCFEPQDGCIIRNITYRLVYERRRCIHGFSYAFTIGDSSKELTFVDDELVLSTDNCTAERGLLPPRLSPGPTPCFRSKPICFFEKLPCAKPAYPCYVLFIEELNLLDFLSWAVIIIIAVCIVLVAAVQGALLAGVSLDTYISEICANHAVVGGLYLKSNK